MNQLILRRSSHLGGSSCDKDGPQGTCGGDDDEEDEVLQQLLEELSGIADVHDWMSHSIKLLQEWGCTINEAAGWIQKRHKSNRDGNDDILPPNGS